MPHQARTAVVLLTAVLFAASACRRSAGPSSAPDAAPRIELTFEPSGNSAIDVIGLPAGDLSRLERGRLSREEWTALLRVVVASGVESDADSASERPAVLGVYSINAGVLRFAPQFPFDYGQRYDVIYDTSHLPPINNGGPLPWQVRRIETTVQVPARESRPPTRIVEVYPTAAELPENQLRLYIAFSAPMGLASGAEHVRLLGENGREVDDPFLPLEVNLWNEDRTRYTVLFDPGRVKRGILPNEEMGRSLVAGRRYTLVVDATWQDDNGQPLAAPFRREFRVGPPEERALDPAEWRLEAPLEGTRNPLAVSFPKPLDYGLLHRALGVSRGNGERVEGVIRLERAETRWLFTPHSPWQPGEYRLVAASILEDVAGNRIGRPFEVNGLPGEPGAQQAMPAAVPFRIESTNRSR